LEGSGGHSRAREAYIFRSLLTWQWTVVSLLFSPTWAYLLRRTQEEGENSPEETMVVVAAVMVGIRIWRQIDTGVAVEGRGGESRGGAWN
jgi:hypothetical protein